jgi:hypothetical protein
MMQGCADDGFSNDEFFVPQQESNAWLHWQCMRFSYLNMYATQSFTESHCCKGLENAHDLSPVNFPKNGAFFIAI